MSRQPSPGPSHALIHNQSLYHPPGLANNPQFAQKQKNKNYVTGITASVEDVKYQAKYKELKKKVKEIESDNDRLYFKLLLAKKNIRRMNLERAILYERLAAVPPTPGRHVQELPPDQDPIFRQQPPAAYQHSRVIDRNDPVLAEYMSTRPEARLVLAPEDGRVVAVEDTPPVPGSAGHESTPLQSPPHGIPLVYSFRHDSGPGYDPNRQLPPLPPITPHIHSSDVPADLPPINESHNHGYSQAQAHSHSQSLGHSSHHSLSNSARPDLDTRMDSMLPARTAHSRSPSTSGDAPADRSRRHDIHELTHPHGNQLPHPHVQIPAQNLPTSPHSHSPASTRGSDRSTGRVHNHQRVGPGANINREMTQQDWELRRELQREREIEREREREREQELAYRERLEREELEEASVAYMRGDAAPGSHHMSRSGSPNPSAGNGASAVPSRPASGQSMTYDVDQSRPKQPRVSNLLGLDRDGAHADQDDRAATTATRGLTEASGQPVDARTRFRGDDEYGGDSQLAGEGGRLPDTRGMKRRRSSDGDEEAYRNDSRGDRMDEE